MSEHEIKPRRTIRFAALARDLEEGIASGRYPVGGLLPTEFELCEQYDASRHTVRMAIAELEDLGLVLRRKKVGTRVLAATSPMGYRQSLASVEDLVQFGQANEREILQAEEIACDAKLARTLGCQAGDRWLCISTLRRDHPGRPPVSRTDIYVDPAYCELSNLARAAPNVLVSDLIEQHYGRRIAEIRQEASAILMPDRLSEMLQTAKGAPGLQVVRHYFDGGGKPFEISVTVHPADRFTLSLHLRREKES